MAKHVVAPLVIALAFGAVTETAGQSLGEIAEKEAERRKTVQSSGKVFTNNSLRAEPPPSPTSVPAPAAPSPSGDAASAPPPDAQPPSVGQPDAAGTPGAQPQPDATRTEAYWRDRLIAVREALARARSFAEALQTRINVLSADFVNRDDPAQRTVVAADRDRALAELRRVQQEIADHEKAIAAIQDEARRAGVPAGWVR
jgi:hypothetical protein